MTSRNADKFERENPNAIMIDSKFTFVNYIFIKNHLVIDGNKSGTLAISKDNLKQFLEELTSVVGDSPFYTEKQKDERERSGQVLKY